ncbi:MAG TPA: isoprenyl transferase [Atopostipes sp.]|nr:isoprenyl transferase [Atopostipes sp.]
MSNNNNSSRNILNEPVPNHVAIIMDGNGRWAQERGLDRSEGHKEGVEAIRRVALSANDLGIKVLTLYAFSTENWKRPVKEIQYLMALPGQFLSRFVPELNENNVKVTVTGFKKRVPDFTKRSIYQAVEETKNNTGMILNFAFNYGGRAEIINAIQEIAIDVENGRLKPEAIDESVVSNHLLTAQLGEYQDVDFLIRSSGEKRLSNFLLWQNAYSEFYFTKEFWPDYNEELFEKAILEYQRRNRRFGGV